MMKMYDYVIVGAGISGCSVAYELNKYSDNILLIDFHDDVGKGASGVAGAFLSPLLGKPNELKNLITTSLKYSTKFYKKNISKFINNCGTIRIPKNKRDEEKFKSYIPFMDFKYTKKEDGYFFEKSSVVDSFNICKVLSKKSEKLLNYKVKKIRFIDNTWIIDDKIQTKYLILTTGANIKLIDEAYFNIRAVWGQRIDISTTTVVKQNYHKNCSVSQSSRIDKNRYKVSIGATHHRLEGKAKELCPQCINLCVKKEDTNSLISMANDIIKLENIKVLKELAGARASSVDYFPMVGELIDSRQTLEEFPYLKNGTNVKDERFTKYKNLYVLNGVGGRGFVLAPFLAKKLIDFIIHKKEIQNNLTVNRLFKRWVKKLTKQ